MATKKSAQKSANRTPKRHLVLFEEIDGEPRYVTADDGSGEDRNAIINYKFFAGRKYHIRLRLFYPGQTGITSVLIT